MRVVEIAVALLVTFAGGESKRDGLFGISSIFDVLQDNYFSQIPPKFSPNVAQPRFIPVPSQYPPPSPSFVQPSSSPSFAPVPSQYPPPSSSSFGYDQPQTPYCPPAEDADLVSPSYPKYPNYQNYPSYPKGYQPAPAWTQPSTSIAESVRRGVRHFLSLILPGFIGKLFGLSS